MHHSPISLAHRHLDVSLNLNLGNLLSLQASVSSNAKPCWNSAKFNSTITTSNITAASQANVEVDFKGVGKHFTLYQDAWNGNEETPTGLPDPRTIEGKFRMRRFVTRLKNRLSRVKVSKGYKL